MTLTYRQALGVPGRSHCLLRRHRGPGPQLRPSADEPPGLRRGEGSEAAGAGAPGAGVIPRTSRTQLRFVASGCRSRRQIRGTDVPLSTAFGWWQVQGSNLGRLSRRFYREPAARVRHGRSPVGLLRWCSLADLDVSPWLRAASLARLVARVTWGRADGRQDKGESEA
jgi:hypothetical protein